MALLASIPSPPVNDIMIGPLRFTFYGLLIGIGVAVAWTITVKRYVARGGDQSVVERAILWMVIAGFLGARLGYVITHTARYEGRWLHVFAIWEGGLALFGGLTAGAITVVVLLRRWGGSIPDFLDSLAPALPIAQAIGRWGNYFNQELFGTPSTLPWAVEIAPQHRPDAYLEFATFHPTFLYESLWNLALAAFIFWVDKHRPQPPGRLIGIYLVGYGFIRFVMELLRTDTTFRLLGLSRNGWISIGAVLIGAIVLYVRRPSAVQVEA